jgi:hypothetical protein
MKWGNSRVALPGFALDGQRNPNDWKGNELIRRVVREWVTFLKDKSNFNNCLPTSAGAAGAPGLAEFEARLLLASKKPCPHSAGQGFSLRRRESPVPGWLP